MQCYSPQLTLGVGLKDEATFENFFSGPNQEIVTHLKTTSAGTGERIIFICGARGEGLTHLLHAACHHAHTNKLTSGFLPMTTLSALTPEVVEGFENLQLVCIDDLHLVASNKKWEEALFHLFNRIYDAKGKLIIAANDLPRALPLQLADLISRLSWGVVYQLHSLQDEEKIAALTMRAARRGIHLSPEVAKFILVHCPRQMGALFSALDTLDKASLAAKRRVTIPFVKEVLLK